MLRTCHQGARKAGRLGGLVFVMLILAGCSLRDRSTTILMGDFHPPFSRVAVLEFKDAPHEMAASLVTKIAGNHTEKTKKSRIEPNASSIIRKIFAERIREKPAYQLIDEKELTSLYRYVSPDGLPVEDRAKFFITLGKKLKTEALLIGYVHRYRERIGSSYAVVQPASVAIEIELIRAKDGLTAWRGYFDKTQRSLMENLLELASFRLHRGRWVTASELASEGIAELIQKIPVFKDETDLQKHKN